MADTGLGTESPERNADRGTRTSTPNTVPCSSASRSSSESTLTPIGAEVPSGTRERSSTSSPSMVGARAPSSRCGPTRIGMRASSVNYCLPISRLRTAQGSTEISDVAARRQCVLPRDPSRLSLGDALSQAMFSPATTPMCYWGRRGECTAESPASSPSGGPGAAGVVSRASRTAASTAITAAIVAHPISGPPVVASSARAPSS